jgi:hypothetical protein
MRRRGSTETLSSLIVRVYPGQSRDELLAVRAFGAFMKALSQRVLRNARPVKLMGGTLIVHTSNSAWANSLQLESTAVLDKIKRGAPETRIRKLVFRAGPMPEAALPLPHTPLVPRGGLPLRELPDDIARGLARIHHDELREAVKKAVSVGLAASRDELAAPRSRPGE